MRGAWYLGQPGVATMLRCTQDHRKIADTVYSQIQRESEVGFKSVRCGECNTTLNVNARAFGEWEIIEIPSRVEKEIK